MQEIYTQIETRLTRFSCKGFLPRNRRDMGAKVHWMLNNEAFLSSSDFFVDYIALKLVKMCEIILAAK